MSSLLSQATSQSSLFPIQVKPDTPIAMSVYAQSTIRRAISLLEKHLREPGVAFTSASATRDWLRLKMAGLEREVFMVLLLDNRHRLIGHETLFTGTINHTEVHPREVVKSALHHNAAAVILAHYVPRHIMRLMCPVFLCSLVYLQPYGLRISDLSHDT